MGHQHNHNHIPEKLNKAFAIGIVLNSIYIIIEGAYGILINSMALVADAGHNLSDVLGLVLAWGASYLALKQPTRMRTYGYRKSTILAALLNAIILILAVGAIGIEAVQRFFQPRQINSVIMIYVAAIGILINAVTAAMFIKGKEKDLNIKGAFLHMAADAAVSLGVVIAGVVILKTGLYWIDPLISIIIMLVILFGTWNLLKDSFNLAIDSVPANIETDEVVKYFKSLPGVKEFHDLHIWGMSTTENALTVHIVKEGAFIDDELTKKINHDLHHLFGIEHATVQFETTGQKLSCCADCVK